MHDLLLFLPIIRGKFIAKTECLSELCNNVTRQRTRGDFKIEKKTGYEHQMTTLLSFEIISYYEGAKSE